MYAPIDGALYVGITVGVWLAAAVNARGLAFRFLVLGDSCEMLSRSNVSMQLIHNVRCIRTNRKIRTRHKVAREASSQFGECFIGNTDKETLALDDNFCLVARRSSKATQIRFPL